jgi:hypothetical protein
MTDDDVMTADDDKTIFGGVAAAYGNNISS